MPTALIRKLEHGAHLTAADKAAIAAAIWTVRDALPREVLIEEGDRPEFVHVVLEGLACRYKSLEDGSRQIIAWLLPGDLCDLHVTLLGQMDHGIATLTASRIGYIPQTAVDELTLTRPAVTRALWWASLVDEGVLREWLVSMGRRSAEHQIAHLLCEVLVRLQAVGLAVDGAMDLPITQTDLADTVGLSNVHVNRVIQHLRDQQLISWRGRALTVLDMPGLARFAGFDPNYLHLAPRRPVLARVPA